MAVDTPVDDSAGDPTANGGAEAKFIVPVPSNDAGARDKIEAQVKALMKEYNEAYEFDKNARHQYAVDRRYAAGTADLTWAVAANLIGSFIDILCSTLYARDPDVSAKKSPNVNESGTQGMQDFAKTVELVVSRLWKDAKLKKIARKMIRSTLTVGVGWMKASLLTEKVPQPETEKALNDTTATLARLNAARFELTDPESSMSDDEIDVKKAEIAQLIETYKADIETSVRQFMAMDFVPAQQMQVSLDVQCTEDYLEADWNANHIFVPTKSLKARFPTLTKEDINTAKKYYQKKPVNYDKNNQDLLTPVGSVSSDDADMYSMTNQGEETPSFAKVIELWDRRDMHFKTMIEGVKVWAKEPASPPYGSKRFYPYFRVSFYEIDDTRHPQSLAYRLSKLQDEYNCTRSNQRLTRERSIPGVMFNSTQIADEEAKKISQSKQQELTGIKLTDPQSKISDAFSAKPIGQYDPRLYDVSPILADMDRISGVQQAMQQAAASAQPKTATEASIEQAGAASRTGTDRDLLETMLSDLAEYTTECAVQALPDAYARKIAGAAAFWPAGIDINDVTNMVEVSIEAGTTGKPRSAADMNAWMQALPLLKEAIVHSQQALQAGNKPLFDALGALIRETLVRLGDTTDVDAFIPTQPGPPPPDPKPEVKISLSGKLDPVATQELSGLPPLPPGTPLPGAEGEGGGGPAFTHNPSLQLNPTHAPENHVDNSVHLHIKPSGETNGK